jgi:NTE family protein
VSAGLTAILSGGGARAAAHLGALNVLRDAGLVPTRYVATSMGAVVACGLAAGLVPDQVLERLLGVREREVFRVDRASVLRGWFARSLLRTEPFQQTLIRLLPAERFGDLALPLSVTATDLDTGELVVFGAGGLDVPLRDALLASCALPLFFPPYLLAGRRLADGGLRAVVPLEVAARFPAERVVALDVGAGFDSEIEPGARQPPALLKLHADAQRVLMASNTSAQRELWERTPGRPPLLWIRPRVRRGETFATERLQWYAEEGARAARAALQQAGLT